MVKIQNGQSVRTKFGYWKFEIIWDLVLGIWNLLYAIFGCKFCPL